MTRPSVYEAAGGADAFLALATANHERCLQDPVLSHPFSHGGHPDHAVRLGGYGAEVFGGPPGYSTSCGGHPHMLRIHAEASRRRAWVRGSWSASSGLRTTRACPPIPSSDGCCARTWSGRCPGCWTTPRRGLVR
ncbi:hypothetical protein [Pseudonocardia sp.]|uniref:globin domain-containing protein n=1 Tax=Pseudonocardia sp. TaxID=60912 RepID=UPI00263988DD|nr:hypothetical protein [Pseudonocardia sp.]